MENRVRDLFGENLKRLRKIDPDLAGKIEKGLSITRDIEHLTSRTGSPTLKAKGILLHSLYDPEKEARRFIDSYDLERELIIILGFGLGYHVLEVARRVSPQTRILIIEPQLPVLRSAMKKVDLSNGLDREGVTFLVPESIEELIDSINDDEILASNYELVEHPPSAQVSSAFFRFAKALLSGKETHLKRRSLLPLEGNDFLQLLIEALLTKKWPEKGVSMHHVLASSKDRYTNILLIQLASIGDVVYTTPVFLGLKEGFKSPRVSFLTEAPQAELVKNDPNLDEVIPFDKNRFLEMILDGNIDEAKKGLWDFVSGLRERKFDLIINLHTSPRSAILTRLIGDGGEFWGLCLDEKGKVVLAGNNWMHYRYAEKREGRLSVVELNLLSSGVNPSKRETAIYIDNRSRDSANAILRSFKKKRGERLFGICPGSNYPSRRWPKENFARLGDLIETKYGGRIIIFGGKDDVERGEWIVDSMEGEAINLCGKTSLLELASILSECEVLITNDTGPLHIASAVKTPTITIAGPAWIGPYGPGHLLLVARLACIGCPQYRCHHHTCMQVITPQMVLLALEILLRLKRKEEIEEMLHLPLFNEVEIMYSGDNPPTKLFALSPLKKMEAEPEIIKGVILGYAMLNVLADEPPNLPFSPKMIMERIDQDFLLMDRCGLREALTQIHGELLQARGLCQKIVTSTKDKGKIKDEMRGRLRRIGIDKMINYHTLSLQAMDDRAQFYRFQFWALTQILMTIGGVIEILGRSG